MYVRTRGVQVLRRSEVIKGKKQTNKQIGTWDFLSLAKNSRLRGVHDSYKNKAASLVLLENRNKVSQV